jgi:hypothetical protein
MPFDITITDNAINTTILFMIICYIYNKHDILVKIYQPGSQLIVFDLVEYMYPLDPNVGYLLTFFAISES